MKQSNKDYGTSNSLSEITNEISQWTEKKANKSPLTVLSANLSPKDLEQVQTDYQEQVFQTALNKLNQNSPEFTTTQL